MSKYKEYLDYAHHYYLNDGLHLRVGQSYFNALHHLHPEYANSIAGTEIDPFNCDSRLHEFLVAVEEKLDGLSATG